MKILMVCLGNICRSPLAEGVMRNLINKHNLGWSVASAGTGNWHIGCAPDKRSIAVAKSYGYDISEQRARLFTAKEFDEFDRILVMDKNNYRDVLNLAKNEEQRNKVQFFLPDQGNVTDPYHDQTLFEPVFKQVEARCKALIEEFKN